MTIHTTHLSTGNGMWSLIHQGQAMCADTCERSRAEAAAKQLGLVPTAIWNGDKGEFEPLQSEWKRFAHPL
jgi:hypothetical protein